MRDLGTTSPRASFKSRAFHAGPPRSPFCPNTCCTGTSASRAEFVIQFLETAGPVCQTGRHSPTSGPPYFNSTTARASGHRLDGHWDSTASSAPMCALPRALFFSPPVAGHTRDNKGRFSLEDIRVSRTTWFCAPYVRCRSGVPLGEGHQRHQRRVRDSRTARSGRRLPCRCAQPLGTGNSVVRMSQEAPIKYWRPSYARYSVTKLVRLLACVFCRRGSTTCAGRKKWRRRGRNSRPYAVQSGYGGRDSFSTSRVHGGPRLDAPRRRCTTRSPCCAGASGSPGAASMPGRSGRSPRMRSAGHRYAQSTFGLTRNVVVRDVGSNSR
jgi:hypothetical protein